LYTLFIYSAIKAVSLKSLINKVRSYLLTMVRTTRT